MKKMVEDIKYADDLVYSSTLFEMRDEILKLIELYGDADLDIDSGYSNVTVRILTQREETEQEYQKRLKKEAREKQESLAKKERQQAKEREQYERLKKKFENEQP